LQAGHRWTLKYRAKQKEEEIFSGVEKIFTTTTTTRAMEMRANDMRAKQNRGGSPRFFEAIKNRAIGKNKRRTKKHQCVLNGGLFFV